jgi:hypothetical protein
MPLSHSCSRVTLVARSLAEKLLCQGFEVSLELIEQLEVVGAHTGQLLIGRVNAGLDPHLVEGVLLILPVGLPELGGFEAAVVQGKGLFQVAELGGRLRAVWLIWLMLL